MSSEEEDLAAVVEAALFAAGRPLSIGEIAELTFDLLPTSYLFRKGHIVRMALAGADKDHFAPLPGDPPRVQFHRTRTHPSCIELPLMPSNGSNGVSNGVGPR